MIGTVHLPAAFAAFSTHVLKLLYPFDLQGLIKLLAKNLYAEADVFVREMLQNAHDSVKRRQELQWALPLAVRLDRQVGLTKRQDKIRKLQAECESVLAGELACDFNRPKSTSRIK